MPEILVLADEDDEGIRRLVNRLERRHEVLWWRFGVAEAEVEADAGVDGFRLSQTDVNLRSGDFAAAGIVIYKRRWLQPRPLVRSVLDRRAHRRFSEREWQSLIEGLLLEQEARCGGRWMNAPSAWARTANKLTLLLRAARMGLPVPAFRISTPIQALAGGTGDVVTKAISADEEVEPERHFSTVRLSAAETADLRGRRVTTPALLQEYIAPAHELRAYAILGEMVTVRLQPSARHVDIRHSDREQMAPRLDRLPPPLEAALTELTGELGLGYCAFDLIVGKGGEIGLVDITPAGSWDYFETAEDPFLSDAFAAIVEDRVSARYAGAR